MQEINGVQVWVEEEHCNFYAYYTEWLSVKNQDFTDLQAEWEKKESFLLWCHENNVQSVFMLTKAEVMRALAEDFKQSLMNNPEDLVDMLITGITGYEQYTQEELISEYENNIGYRVHILGAN